MKMATINGITYPKFYRGDHGIDDFPWILSRMRVIPIKLQQEVSDKYENIYLAKKGGDRKEANTYLQGEAKKHRI